MNDLIQCTRCGDKLGEFRFEKGETICRDCKRLPEPKRLDSTDLSGYSRRNYNASITSLSKNPAYRKYLEEHSTRNAQFGSASFRAVGHIDK